MPTFADIVARGVMDCIYVLRISGLPYLWSNAAIPPRWGTTTTTYAGETYTWLPYLSPGQGFGSVSTKIEPKGGVGASGGQDFDIIALGTQSGSNATSTILSLLTSSVARSDGLYAASLAQELLADASGSQALTFLANPWYGGTYPARLYAGTETIAVGTPSADSVTSFTASITRGRFGSQAQTHTGIAREGTKSTGGALYVAEYPLTMVGRIAELWCCPGEWVKKDSGVGWRFNPYGEDLDSTANQIIYAGLVDGVNEDGPIVTFRTSSLDQLIKNSAVKSSPRCQLGQGGLLSSNLVYIGDHNKWVHYDLEIGGGTEFPYIVIPDIAAVSVGDSITVNAFVVTAVAGAPALGQFQIGASELITHGNIATALNLLGPTTFTAYNRSYGVEIIPSASLLAPYNATISITTTNANAIITTSDINNPQSGTLGGVPYRVRTNLPLRRAQSADSQPPYEDVPEGVYTIGELGTYLTDTINETLPLPIRVRVGLEITPPTYDEDNTERTGGGLMRVYCTINPPRQGVQARFILFTEADNNESFLRDLGFVDTEIDLKGGDEGSDPAAEFTREAYATKPPAALRIPAWPRRVPNSLYINYIDPWSDDWMTAGGWVDDDGDAIPAHILIKDAGVFTFTGYAGGNLPALTGVARADTRMSSPNFEEIYIPADIDWVNSVEAARVLALPNVSANRFLLYLLLGGSGAETNHATYDKGWPGCGLHIPARLVDVDGIEALNLRQPNPRNGWVLLDNDDARKIVDEELKATQQQIVADLGQLSMISMDPPLEADTTATVHTVGPAQLVSDPEKGVGFDRQENRIVNVVQVKGNWDARDGKFYFDQTNRQQDSIGTWGEQQPITVELRGLRLTDAEARGKQIAERIFSLYARPYALIEIDLAPLAAWLWRMGDVVDLTHPNVPGPAKGSRGVTSLRCRIVNKVSRFAGGDRAFVTLTLQTDAFSGQRSTIFGPSCMLVYSGTANTWTRVADRFGAQVNGMDDEDYFEVGHRVKVCRLGASTTSTKTIATKSGSDFTFNTSLSGSSGQKYIMWYGDYDDANTTDAQRAFAYFSDYSGRLNTPTATAAAFRYL